QISVSETSFSKGGSAQVGFSNGGIVQIALIEVGVVQGASIPIGFTERGQIQDAQGGVGARVVKETYVGGAIAHSLVAIVSQSFFATKPYLRQSLFWLTNSLQ
ncbi:MAG: hypothetical protein MUF49_32550, partial [Oculatellaceae cyanobacterium Prado106]|nr:hypothetical protein [Oculatellaceae cyanobacterium Prado106]